MTKLVRLIIPFILLGFIGCSHIADYLSIARERGISKEYLDVLNTWTRKETVYSQFETMASISATYRGKAFQDAYRREYDRIYNLTTEEKIPGKAAQKGEASESREFFFYAYLPEKNDNDFSQQTSIWKVLLVNEIGLRIAPLEITKIEKVTPLTEAFYPYINKYYGSCYLLKFPPGTGFSEQLNGSFHLVFTSVLGKATLIWK